MTDRRTRACVEAAMRWTVAWSLLGLALGLGAVLLTGVRGQEVTGCRDGKLTSECRTYRVHTPRAPGQLATAWLAVSWWPPLHVRSGHAEACDSPRKAEVVRNRARGKGIGDLEVPVAEYIEGSDCRRLLGEVGLLPPEEYETCTEAPPCPGKRFSGRSQWSTMPVLDRLPGEHP
jgi:hypothetical protein